jgi:TRAP-type C4-dicarboxylate transport system, periplasmic component
MNRLTIATALALAAGPAFADEITYSSHLPPRVLVNAEGIIPLFEAVSAATGGEITAQYYWAGQLYDLPGNFDAVSEGVVDAAFTLPSENQASFPINLLFSDLYHLGGDPYVTTGAALQTMMVDCPSCAQEYAEADTVFLGSYATTPQLMVCNRALATLDDLQGTRVIGAPTIAAWVASLGAVQVTMPPPARLEALQRSQADCTIIPAEWLISFSIVEGVQTIVDAPSGAQFSHSMLTMNRDRWEGLSDAARDAFREQLPLAVARLVAANIAKDGEALEAAHARGVAITDLGGTYAAAHDRFIEATLPDIIAAAEARGVGNAAEIVATFRANMAAWQGLMAEHGAENFAALLQERVFDPALR